MENINLDIEKPKRGRPRKILDGDIQVSSTEARKLYNKRHYEKNQEKILEHQRETVVCECGIELRKYGVQKHLKSKYHICIMKNKKV